METTINNQDYTFGKWHVRRDSEPLCRVRGISLSLCSPTRFKRLDMENRCRTCERLLGPSQRPYDNPLGSLSEQQRGYLRRIAERTGDDKIGQWCAAVALSSNKTGSGRTSLHRSLRRLERRGLIDRRRSDRGRCMVRLTGRVKVAESGRIVRNNDK